MKKFFKWVAIVIGAILFVIWFYSQDKGEQRWFVVGASLGWGIYAILNAIEKARLDIAERLLRIEQRIP